MNGRLCTLGQCIRNGRETNRIWGKHMRKKRNQKNQGNCVWRKSLGKDPERGWKLRRIKGAKQP